jgi:hypothetical protein
VNLDEGSFEPNLELWDAWHPSEAARRLENVEVSWYVVAGWALDLFQGRQTRAHEDLEIGVAAGDFGAIRHGFQEFDLFVVGDGRARPATQAALAAHHQTWVRERRTGMWRLDVIREPWDDDEWVCRRDPRIRLAGAKLISRTGDGIPYAQPEVVLLFKAKATRPKDDDDFARVLPLLDADRRRWLADALGLVHPGHRWLSQLAA